MIFLASRSPRRYELLKQIQIEFELVDVNVPEQPQDGEAPADYVQRLALEKARAGYQSLDTGGAVVLGADTAVVIDDMILGKPRDKNDGLAMLEQLSGRMHKVYSGIAVVKAEDECIDLSISEVAFRKISTGERERYWESGEPADKAGAYAIQGMAAVFVQHLSGSYSGVMGLPLYETGKLLSAF